MLVGQRYFVPAFLQAFVAGLPGDTDPEYELRFDADEEYIAERIDRIGKMSLREVKLCNHCTEKHPGTKESRQGAVRELGSEC